MQVMIMILRGVILDNAKPSCLFVRRGAKSKGGDLGHLKDCGTILMSQEVHVSLLFIRSLKLIRNNVRYISFRSSKF